MAPRGSTAACIAALLGGLAPATAHAQQPPADRFERHGSELVYHHRQPDHGKVPVLSLVVKPDRIEQLGGCPERGECSLAGITAVRVFMGDAAAHTVMNLDFANSDAQVFVDGGEGHNQVTVNSTSDDLAFCPCGGGAATTPGRGRVTYTGGSGVDHFAGRALAMDADGRAGDDHLTLAASERFGVSGGPGNDKLDAAGPGTANNGYEPPVPGTPGPGPYTVSGGDGNDTILARIGAGGQATIFGDAGNDILGGGGNVEVSCGLGADQLTGTGGPVTDGCAPQFYPTKSKRIGTYSVEKRELALTLGRMQASGARLEILVYRWGRRPGETVTLARSRTIRPKAGRLRQKFRMTPAGVRYFRSSRNSKSINIGVNVDDPRTGDSGENGGIRGVVRRGG